MVTSPDIPREIPDLVEALRRHAKLLEQYATRAFQDHEYDYLGEVAAKLRLLVYDRGRNKPLLLALMDEFGLDVPITLDGPPIMKDDPGQPGPGDQITLREYLSLNAVGIQTPSRGFVMLKKKELIGTWAAQHGAAHEDWELEEAFATALSLNVYIGGLPALSAELKVTTETVLHVVDRFLKMLAPELIELKAAEFFLTRNPNSVPAHRGKGIALAKLGKYEKAVAELRLAVEVEPTHAPTQNNLGLALLHQSHLPEAAQAFLKAIELDENYVDAHYNLACVFSRQSQFSRCLEELARVKYLDGFVGDADPTLDSDLAAIRNDPEYGPQFRELVQGHQ